MDQIDNATAMKSRLLQKKEFDVYGIAFCKAILLVNKIAALEGTVY